jgi:hypothetical protein
MSTKDIDYLLLLSTQPTDRVENGQIGLTRPVLFQTLPSSNPNVPIRRNGLGEGIDQGRLADAGFTGDKSDLPFSLHASSPAGFHLRQRSIAPDNSLSDCRALRCTQNDVNALGFLIRCLHRYSLCDLADETIASAMGGFDKPWGFRVVAENLSQLANSHLEDTFSDKSSRPNGVEKFIFCNELARTPKQVIQNREGFGSEFYGLWTIPDAFIGQVQPKRIENDAFLVRHSAPKVTEILLQDYDAQRARGILFNLNGRMATQTGFRYSGSDRD